MYTLPLQLPYVPPYESLQGPEDDPLGGQKPWFFIGFPWRIPNLEAGGQREYPLGSKRALWEAQKHGFFNFPQKIANLEAGGQREYPLGDQREYLLKTLCFFCFPQKISNVEAGS